MEHQSDPGKWTPPAETDKQIRVWMETQGWPVTTTHYDFTREVFAWRHETSGQKDPTLRMSQAVLEDNDAAMLVEALQQEKVAELIKAKPGAYTWLRREGGSFVVEQLFEPPS